jgi:hypothetical protein
VSRQEEIAGCDGNLNELSKNEVEISKASKKKVKLKESVENKAYMDKKTKEAIEIEETKIKEIQLLENIIEVEPQIGESPKITVELYDKANDVGKMEVQVVKNDFENGNVEKSWSGTQLFLRNSPETSIGNLLENLPHVNKFPVHVTKIQKYLRPEVEEYKTVNETKKQGVIEEYKTVSETKKEIIEEYKTENDVNKEMTNYAIEPTLTEQQNVIEIPDNKEILTSALILEKNPE